MMEAAAGFPPADRGGGSRQLREAGDKEVLDHFQEMDRLWRPRAVAVVGVSDKLGNMGQMFALSLKKQGFPGPIIGVNPTSELKSLPWVRRLQDYEGPLDHIIISVPARLIESVIQDAVAKGVRSAAMFTSGFAEEGHDQGRRLQERIAALAREGGLRLIGPNCMGLHYPPAGLSFRPDMPTAWGRTAMTSQSGGMAISTLMTAAERGVPLGKVVSYGNECDLTAQDFIRYFADDPETDRIVMYVEGTINGPDLAEAMIVAGRKKPLLVCKGGRTEVGTRAAASHTGALAGSGRVWEAVFKQAGAKTAGSIDELSDLIEIEERLAKPKGKGVALLTISGGFGVFATDVVAEHGFTLPEFSAETKAAMGKYINLPGTSVKNPLDMAAAIFWQGNHEPIYAPLKDDPNIDAVLVLLSIEYVHILEGFGGIEPARFTKWFLKQMFKGLKAVGKPAAFVFFESIALAQRLEYVKYIRDAGFAVFPTVERAMKALGAVCSR
jgi:acyl-CoA synthetase (NDP forming)